MVFVFSFFSTENFLLIHNYMYFRIQKKSEKMHKSRETYKYQFLTPNSIFLHISFPGRFFFPFFYLKANKISYLIIYSLIFLCEKMGKY